MQLSRTVIGGTVALVLALLLGQATHAQENPGLDMRYGWTIQIGQEDERVQGGAIATDSAGNLFILTVYEGPVDFDPGEGEDWHSCDEVECLALSKLDDGRSYLWTQSWVFSDNTNPVDVQADVDGSVFVTGSFRATQDLDPGPGIDQHTAGRPWGSFIAKLSAEGDFLWARSYGKGGWAHPTSLFLDAAGTAYVAGVFGGELNLGSPEGTYRLKANGRNDACVYIVDGSGRVRQPLQIGGPGNDYAHGVAVTGGGDIYIVGHAGPDTDFNPGEGKDYHPTKDPIWDAFVTRVNGDGSYGWTRTFGGPGYDWATSVVVSPDGHVVASGFWDGPYIDLDPSENVDIHRSRGDYDAFVSRFTPDGDYEWGRSLGADRMDEADALGVDSQGAVYFGGHVYEPWTSFGVDMDPTEGIDLRFPRGADFFVTKLTARGDYAWSLVLGTDGYDRVEHLFLDSADNLFYSGMVSGERRIVDFDPTENQDIRRTTGHWDIAVTKLLPPE
jgi:hypothetical protein